MQEKKPNPTTNRESDVDNISTLPTIPDKRYFTIGEAAQLCGVKPHVLRYWEQEFLQLKPTKRRGNRRYYLQDDVLLVRQIRKLLYDDGFTIEGARAQFSQNSGEIRHSVQSDETVKKVIAELELLLQNLRSVLKDSSTIPESVLQ